MPGPVNWLGKDVDGRQKGRIRKRPSGSATSFSNIHVGLVFRLEDEELLAVLVQKIHHPFFEFLWVLGIPFH